MSDHRPRSRDRNLHWLGPASIGVVLVAVLAAALFSQANRPAPPPPPAPVEAPPAAPAAPTEPPAPPPVLSRMDLIAAAEEARAAFAAPATPAAGADGLVGRSFKVAIPFGCPGARGAAAGAQAFTDYDAAAGVLRITARPGTWTTLPLVSTLSNAPQIERVEGFWIPRPWSPADDCPPRVDTPAPATPTPPPYPTLGLAQVFEQGASRVPQRSGRPYEVVRRIGEAETVMLDHAYRLVLEGRIVGFADGRAVRCWAESPDHRPVCLYGVAFERVSLRDAETDDLLAEWRE